MGEFTRRAGEDDPVVVVGEDGEENESFRGAHPALWEYLTEDRWPDGKKRERSSLSVLIEGARWKVGLQDRANKRSAWKSGGSLAAALGALEMALRGQEVDWRKWTR